MLVDFLGLPKQLEVVLVIISGVLFLLFDSSLFYMKSNLEEVWGHDYHSSLQEYHLEIPLRYILSGVIFVRAFTAHIFLALYIVMLWPAIFGDRPNLMVPWLVVGSIRCVAVNVVTLVVGSYVCIRQKGHHPICFDYFVSQIIEHGPSFYAWLTVLSYYKTLHAFRHAEERRKSVEYELLLRRKRARGLDSSQINFNRKVDDGRNLLSESTLGNLIHRLGSESFSTCSRSLDSLLKTQTSKEAKDEIMYSDLGGDDIGPPSGNILERAMALLNIKEEDILQILAGRDSASFTVLAKLEEHRSNTAGKNLPENEEGNVDKTKLLTKSQSATTPTADVGTKMPPKTFENEVELTSISLETESKSEKQGKEAKQEEEKVKPDFLGKVAGVMQSEIKKMVHFGCQVDALNRSFNLPTERMKKKFRISKKILFNAW